MSSYPQKGTYSQSHSGYGGIGSYSGGNVFFSVYIIIIIRFFFSTQEHLPVHYLHVMFFFIYTH